MGAPYHGPTAISTIRGLSLPCPLPECRAEINRWCSKGAPYIHPARRNLFWIDGGRRKTVNEYKLHMSNVPEEEAQFVQSELVRLSASLQEIGEE